MKPTGQFKTDFEKWLRCQISCSFSQYPDINKRIVSVVKIRIGKDEILFEDLPFSMQYGCFVDFADSVGIDIEMGISQFYSLKLFRCKVDGLDIYKKSRHEAREQAIIKLQELYNQKFK